MRNRKTIGNVMLAALIVGGLPAADVLAAESKCDAAITKAAGKKASCKAGVIAKGYANDIAPDVDKLAKCDDKFASACAKAKSKEDCVLQSMPCGSVDYAVETCVEDVVDNQCAAGDGGFCWFLGAEGASCDATCAVYGFVYDSATTTYAGSGGTAEACGTLLDNLGAPAGPVTDQACADAIDCFYVPFSNFRFRCTSPPGDAGATYVNGRRACACTNAP